MRLSRLSETSVSLTRTQDKRTASLMNGSDSYLPLRRTIAKIFPRYLAGHLIKLSSFMMLIFPLSRQLQIQTEHYHYELTAHTHMHTKAHFSAHGIFRYAVTDGMPNGKIWICSKASV